MALGTEPPTGPDDPQNVHFSFPCTQMQKAIELQIIFTFLIIWKPPTGSDPQNVPTILFHVLKCKKQLNFK